MKIIKNMSGLQSWYLAQKLPFFKSIEFGYQIRTMSDLAVRFSFRTKGDHAGLSTSFQVFHWFFEFNVHDSRHWNIAKDRFYLPGEEPVFEGYPLA